MATFVYFTRTDGSDVYCNLDHIGRIMAGQEGRTAIRFTETIVEIVTETIVEIANRINSVL